MPVFFEICTMKKFLFLFLFISLTFYSFSDQFHLEADTKTVSLHFDSINLNTTINFQNNDVVMSKINSYLTKDKKLLSKMLSLSKYYFPIFESYLDKYNLPFELKYLAIVESSLNTLARSKSGARGLWQFMYPTGKAYDLNVNSYIDERLDPHKSTEAACKYFLKLYDIFGDWNLVLAAYNGGPGYIQRMMLKTGHDNFWDLRPFLRTETRDYVPKFIAITYLMHHHNIYNIYSDTSKILLLNTDTITIDFQLNTTILSEITCINREDLRYYNPAYKDDIYPINSKISLPSESVSDFFINYDSYKLFASAVKKKEILIDETRLIYSVVPGDYLGKIANNHKIKIFQIQKWNNLRTTQLNIGDKLVLYVSNDVIKSIHEIKPSKLSYTVQKGDTLWDIARMYSGVSVAKIKKLNNLTSNTLKPGYKLVIPEV